MSIHSKDQLFEDIGLGNKMPLLIAKHLCQEDVNAGLELDNITKASDTPLMIKGSAGMVMNLAKYCRPIPDDLIIGFLIQADEVSGEYPVELRIELLNQYG